MKNCKNCKHYKITKNEGEICRLRGNKHIISVLCCKDYKQAHARRKIAHTRKIKTYILKHYTLK